MMVKENKGVTLITLVVTIVVLIILTGITIGLTLGTDGLIQRAKDTKLNIQLAKEEMETNLNELNSNTGGNDEFTTENAELVAFKLAISDAIYEGSDNKLQISDHKIALTDEFTNSIKQIVKEVTKDATATAEDIAEGKTAYVNGEKITGKGSNTIDISTITQNTATDYTIDNATTGEPITVTKTFNMTDSGTIVIFGNGYSAGGTTQLYGFSCTLNGEKVTVTKTSAVISYNSGDEITAKVTVSATSKEYAKYARISWVIL